MGVETASDNNNIGKCLAFRKQLHNNGDLLISPIQSGSHQIKRSNAHVDATPKMNVRALLLLHVCCDTGQGLAISG